MAGPENFMLNTSVMCCSGLRNSREDEWLWDSVPKLECAAQQALTRSHPSHSDQFTIDTFAILLLKIGLGFPKLPLESAGEICKCQFISFIVFIVFYFIDLFPYQVEKLMLARAAFINDKTTELEKRALHILSIGFFYLQYNASCFPFNPYAAGG